MLKTAVVRDTMDRTNIYGIVTFNDDEIKYRQLQREFYNAKIRQANAGKRKVNVMDLVEDLQQNGIHVQFAEVSNNTINV